MSKRSGKGASKGNVLKKLGAAVTRAMGVKTSKKTAKDAVSLKWRAAALKAWRTRRARAAQKPARASVQGGAKHQGALQRLKDFQKKHGHAFAPLDLSKNHEARLLVIRLLRMGVDPVILEKATGLGRQTIAAYRAHHTMGTYNITG